MTESLLRILMTSDTHAHWLGRPTDSQHDLRNTASILRQQQAKAADYTLTIDLGDFLQGSSFATYLRQEANDGRILAQAMNDLNYDIQVIGNHEFNFGAAYRDQSLQELKAQILAANIVKTGTMEPYMGQAYEIIPTPNFTIGVIGVTTSYIPHWELPAHYAGIEFIDAYEALAHYVPLVRPQVDVLIVAYHGGFERDLATGQTLEDLTKENQAYQILTGISGIDVLLTGHQHREINQRFGSTWVCQAGYAGEYIAEVELQIATKQITAMRGSLINSDSSPKDAQIERLMQKELQAGKVWLETVLGTAPLRQTTQSEMVARQEGHPYIEFLNQVQLRETEADFSAVSLMNRAFLDFHGAITNEILLQSYPYFNLIAKVQLTGAELAAIIEFDYEYFMLNQVGELIVNPDYIDPKPRHYNFDVYSGLAISLDMKRPFGQRLVSLVNEATGEAIQADGVYTLAVSQYRAVGGGDYRWFSQDKILSLSQIDIANLIKHALHDFTAEEWEYINTHYQHVHGLSQYHLGEMTLN